MTGNHLPGTPTSIQPRQAETEAFYREWFPPDEPADEPARKPVEPISLSDQTLLDKMFAAPNGGAIRALWSGDTSDHQGDHSRADQALCSHLAFWTQHDATRIDGLFRQSGLMRDKWNRADYRERTITKAINGSPFYDPNYGRGDKVNKGASMWQGNGVAVDEAIEENEGTRRPVIKIGTDATEVIDAAEAALMTMPGAPAVFQRTRSLCMITKEGPRPKWLRRTEGAPTIAEISHEFLWELCSRASKWQRFDKRAKEWQQTLPPAWVSKTLLHRDGWKFPHLRGIITSPTLRPDGSVLDSQGYDPDTGLYLDMDGVVFPKIPDHVEIEDAYDALTILEYPFKEFMYEKTYHLSTAIAGVLTLVVRDLIDGPVPVWMISATKAGSGKTLLAECMSIIGTGRAPAAYSQTDDDEERKRLMTVAADGNAVILIDNVTRAFGSPFLDGAITSCEVADRLLGANKTISVPWRAVVLVTGKNVVLKGDIVRRAMPLILDPMMEKPEEKDDFTIKNLSAYVHEHRPELVTAALTIIKGFFDVGRPQEAGVSEIGKFEEWNHLIRHALIWLGCEDPAEGRATLADESDPERSAIRRLILAWRDCYGLKTPKTIRNAVQDVLQQSDNAGPGNVWSDLGEALAEFDYKSDGKQLDSKRLGNALRKQHGHVCNVDGVNLRWEKAQMEARDKVQTWQVRAI